MSKNDAIDFFGIFAVGIPLLIFLTIFGWV